MNFGDILKQLRLNSNLTQEDLANKLNALYEIKLNKGMISKWESNKSEPSMKYVRVFSKFFNVTLDYLLGLKETNITELKNTDNYSKEEKNHIEDLRKLNDIGKEKVITYTKDLLDNPKFNKNNDISCTIRDIKPVVEDDGYVPRVFAAHSDGIDEETNRRNIEMIKRLELEKRRKKNNQ